MLRIPRRLMRSCKLCQRQLQPSERYALSDLLHYLAPLVVPVRLYGTAERRSEECAESHLLDDYDCCWFSAHFVAAINDKRPRYKP